MDNELLFRLLKEHNRLIIPEFGAFLKKEQGDSVIIVFTPFLKKDDGVLKNAISEHFSVEESDAAGILTEYVSDLQSRLSSQGTYYIDGLGLFKHDSNGTLTFIYEPSRGIPTSEPKTPQPPAQELQLPAREPIVTQPINQQFIDQSNINGAISAASTTERTTQPVTPKQMPTSNDARPFAQPFSGIKQPHTPQQQYTPPRPTQNQQPHTPQQQYTPPRPTQNQQPHTPQQQYTPTRPTQNQQPLPRAATPKPAFTQPAPRPTSPPLQQQPRPAQPTQRPGQQRPATNKQRPPMVRSAQNQGQRKKIFQKADLWLLIAIVAALLVLGLIIFANNTPEPEIILNPSPTETSQVVIENSYLNILKS